jgi:hypothetical protein
MQERTLTQFLTSEGTFTEKYICFKKRRIFQADSVMDFFLHKDGQTLLSNLLFFSNPHERLFILENVSLQKVDDKIYNFNWSEERTYAKAYSIKDKTGEFDLFWATQDSKIPFSYSCDKFETAKFYRGDTPNKTLIRGLKNSEDYFIYDINFNSPSSINRIEPLQLKFV